MNDTQQKPLTNSERSARDFAEQVAKHIATITHDTGLHRHIECREPGTYNRAFNITTWPGYLAITGDMSSYVFCRLDDMFAFFRSDSGRVNLSYWSEKLVSTSNRGGHREYSEDLFRAAITERFAEWLEGESLTEEETAELQQRVNDEVLYEGSNGEVAAHTAAHDFEHHGQPVFTDFWETNLKEYTYHFAWCCHAIVWAIQQYDHHKSRPESQEVQS